MGLTNKSADENDVKEISRLLGQKSLNIMTLFRLGKNVQGKTRPLKIVLDFKTERRFLLENAKHIEAKVPEKFKREMPKQNNFTDSQHMLHGQRQEDPYNNTAIQQDETIEGGFDLASSKPGPINSGQVEDADSSR